MEGLDTADVRPRGITGGVIGRKVDAVRINDHRHASRSEDAVRQTRRCGEEHPVQGRTEGGVRSTRAEGEARSGRRAGQGAEGDGRARGGRIDDEEVIAPRIDNEGTRSGFGGVGRGVGRILEGTARKAEAVGTAQTVGQEDGRIIKG